MPDRIYLSQFTHYLAAKTAQDADKAVATISAQLATEYQHWKNPWQRPQDALLRDRRGSRDGQQLVELAAGAPPNRKALYTRAAQQWQQVAPWWDGLQHERLSNREVQVGDLTVVVPRLCAERHPDGELEVLYVRFNQGRLPRHVIFGVMRIVQMAHPEATISFVDAPQITLHTSRGIDLSVYDEWITQAGSDLVKQLAVGQDQADAA